MSKPDLERTAYTIECFLNALRMNDGLARTKVEVGIVRWLASSVRAKEDSAVYSKSVIDCFSRGRNLKSYEVPEITLDKTVWTDGSQISEIDRDEYLSTGKIIKLGIEGLDLTMPAGQAAEVSVGCSNSSDDSPKE
ncbi:MAG: hypothetical protein WCL27_04430 [Betaproteobacteria bacterium]